MCRNFQHQFKPIAPGVCTPDLIKLYITIYIIAIQLINKIVTTLARPHLLKRFKHSIVLIDT